MARIQDLNEYEKHFYDVMKARGYKSSIITDSYSLDGKGVRLTHPEGIFRFMVEGFTFYVQTPKTEPRAWGHRKKDVIKWYIVRNLFTDEEHKTMKDALIVPDLGDALLVARIEATIKANDEEETMRGVRQARRTALSEAAPDMWRALRVITLDPQINGYLLEFDPQALKQCHNALAEAGEQDPEDLSVARSGLAQSQHDTIG